jgi:APA family basic amino acid/polyamine antiporter
MVGTGVFTTSGFLLADLESRGRVLMAWAAGGLMAALGALSYGALARRLPESGGEYLFLSRTVHPAAGYVAGWISFLAGFSAPLAASAIAFGEYAKGWWPGTSPRALASVLLVVAMAVHSTTVRGGMTLHNAAVVLKIVVIALFIYLAGSRLPSTAPLLEAAPGEFPLGAFAIALIWISFSYSGWNAAVYVGGEVVQPERTLPRALLLGTALVTGLYLLLNAIFLAAVPIEELKGQLDVAVIAARGIGGAQLGAAVSLLISLVLVAHVSAMTMAGPRVSAQMARDGYLPQWLAPWDGPPRLALLLQTAAALLMLWLAAYDRLLTYIGFTLGLCTAAVVVGLVRVRLAEGASFRVPGWPWVPMAFLAMTLWTTVFSIARRPVESLLGLGVIVLGILAWRVFPTRR